MSSAEAIKKLQSLSEERAGKVCALIEDLAELEALENAADLKDGREALAEVEAARTPLFANTKTAACEKPAEPATIPYEQLRREAGLDR
jgi:transcription elongation GreA/GreB family factor